MMMSDSEILDQVCPHVAEALGVEEEEVLPEAKLVDDLGAESIDFLDIFFRVEKAFGIKLDTAASGMMDDERYVRDGILTDEGVAEVRQRLPGVDLRRVEESHSVQDIQRGFTVGTIVELVKARLAKQAAAG